MAPANRDGGLMAFPAPTVTAPVLSDRQMSFGGLTIGPGTPYRIQVANGLDLPTIRSGDSTRPRDHGELIGLDLMKGRTVDLSILTTSDGTGLDHALKALGAATVPGGTTEVPLWVKPLDLPQLVTMCRVRKRKIPWTLTFMVASVAKTDLQLHSTDPRLYGATLNPSAHLPIPLGGLSFPATFPLSFGGGSATGDIAITHGGNAEMRPVLVIAGPCTNPKVVNDQAGWSLTFTNPTQTGYTLATGESLTVDTEARSVLLTTGAGAGAPHENWVVPGSTWPSVGVAGIRPGVNTIQFSSSDATTVAGTLTVWWAPAYLL